MLVAAPYRLLACLLIALCGCEFPKDAEGTLQRVLAEGVLRVGYSERPPWVIAPDAESPRDGPGENAPTGIEPRLIKRWASDLGIEVHWVRGSESTLLRALEERRVDLMIGGLTASLGWTRRAGITQAFHEAKLVVAVPQDEAPPARSHLAGRRISYPATRPDFAAAIAKVEGLPQATASVVEEPTALYAFEAARLGLTPNLTELATERLVMLVPPGEGAFLLALDRFLASARRQGLVIDPAHE